MIPVCTLKDIDNSCGSRYDYNEHRIVVIMLARYSISDNCDIIKQQYDYWHYRTGEALDFFWLGYGAYAFPGEPGQYLLENCGNGVTVYFDTQVFVNEIEKLQRKIQFKYRDSMGMLICNYYNGHIHLEENVYFDLGKLIESKNGQAKLRTFADFLIKICKKNDDVANVGFKFKTTQAYLRKDTELPEYIIKGLNAIIKMKGI